MSVSFCPRGRAGSWLPSMHHRAHDRGGGGLYQRGLHPGCLHQGGLHPGAVCIGDGEGGGGWGLHWERSVSRGEKHGIRWDMVNKQVERILLECFLVKNSNISVHYYKWLPALRPWISRLYLFALNFRECSWIR